MARFATFTNSKGEHGSVNLEQVVNMTDTGKGTRLFTSLIQPGKDGKPVRVTLTASEPIEHFIQQAGSNNTPTRR